MASIANALIYNSQAQTALNINLTLDAYGWFNDQKTELIFFNGPMLLVMTTNLLFFVLTIINIRKTTKETAVLRLHNKDKIQL